MNVSFSYLFKNNVSMFQQSIKDCYYQSGTFVRPYVLFFLLLLLPVYCTQDTILVYMLCAIFINHNFSSFSQPQKLIAMNGARDYKLQLL